MSGSRVGHSVLSSLFKFSFMFIFDHFYTSFFYIFNPLFHLYIAKMYFHFLNSLCEGFVLRERNFSISRELSPLCYWCTELISFCWVEKDIYKEPWHFNQPNYLSLTSCSPPCALIYLEILQPGLLTLVFLLSFFFFLSFFNSVCLEWEFSLCRLVWLSVLNDVACSDVSVRKRPKRELDWKK